MIACAIAWWGLCEAQKLKKREEFLRAIIAGLNTIKAEIEFGKFELEYILKRLDIKYDHGFFAQCCTNIKEFGIKCAWDDAIEAIKDKGFIKDCERDIISELGNFLGMSDIRGQKTNIELTVERLRQNLSVAEDENIRLGKVYRGCGVLLGVFVMIILI